MGNSFNFSCLDSSNSVMPTTNNSLLSLLNSPDIPEISLCSKKDVNVQAQEIPIPRHSFSMPQHHFDTPYTPNMVPSHNNIPHPAYQNMRPVTPMKSRFDRYYPHGHSMRICEYPQQSSHANFRNRLLQNQQQSYHGVCAQDIHPTITAPARRKSLVSNIYIVNKHEMLTNSLDLLAGEAEMAKNAFSDPITSSSGKENKTTRKHTMRGTGSKSGAANQCDGGGLDDEIAKLSIDAKKAAKLKFKKEASVAKAEKLEFEEDLKPETLLESNKLKIVQYVTDDRQWSQFHVNQNKIWSDVSLVLYFLLLV